MKEEKKNLMLLGKFFEGHKTLIFLGSYKVKYPGRHGALVDSDLYFPIIGNDICRQKIFELLRKELLTKISSYIFMKCLNKKVLKKNTIFNSRKVIDKDFCFREAQLAISAMSEIVSYMLTEKFPPGKISKSKNNADGMYQPDLTYVELKKLRVRLTRFRKGKGFRKLSSDLKKSKVEESLRTVSFPISELLLKFIPNFQQEIDLLFKHSRKSTLSEKINQLDEIIKMIEKTNTRNRELEEKVMSSFQTQLFIIFGKKNSLKLVRLLEKQFQKLGFRIYKPYYYDVKNLIESHKNRYKLYKPKREINRTTSRIRKKKNIRRRYKNINL